MGRNGFTMLFVLLASSSVITSSTPAPRGVGHRVTAAPPQLANEGHRFRSEAPDRISTENSTRILEFTSQGVRYVPKQENASKRDRSFHFQFVGIATGRSFHLLADGPSPIRSDDTIIYVHGADVREIYRVLKGGVEQIFILGRPFDIGKNDLAIVGRVTTELRPHRPSAKTSQGLLFYFEDCPVLSYSAAIVFDARGRQKKADVELRDGHLRIILDGAWLREAAYPIIVDPFIGPIVPLVAAGSALGRHAIAGDPDRGRYLVVWEQTTADDVEIFGRLVESDGRPAACYPDPFAVSLSPATRDISPAVAYDPARRRFLVVWEQWEPALSNFPPSVPRLRGRFVGGADNCATVTPSGPALEIASEGDERSPDVAVGTSRDGRTRFLVTFLRDIGDGRVEVCAQWLDAEGSRLGEPLRIGDSGGFAPRFHPSVAFGEPGRAESFSIVYRAVDQTLRMVKVAFREEDPAETQQVLLDPLVQDDPSGEDPPSTDVRPVVAYSRLAHRWMVCWIEYSPRFGAVLQWTEILATSFLWQSAFTTLLGSFRFVRGLSMTSSPYSPDFVTTLAVGARSLDGFDIFVFHLQYSIDFFSTTLRRDALPGGRWNDLYPLIVPGAQRDEYFVVWQRGFAGEAPEIVGQKYVP